MEDEDEDGWTEWFCLTPVWLNGSVLVTVLAFCSVFSLVSGVDSVTELAGALGGTALEL